MSFLIRREQFAAIADADLTRRVKRSIIMEYELSRTVPGKDDRRGLDAMIRHGLAVARAYGFETEQDLATFVLHMILINPAFHREPTIHAILVDPSMPAADKPDALLGIPEEAWEAAEAMTDPVAYWNEVKASKSPGEPA